MVTFPSFLRPPSNTNVVGKGKITPDKTSSVAAVGDVEIVG